MSEISFGGEPAGPARDGRKRQCNCLPSALGSDSATLSSAGNEVQMTAGEDGVRMDKVAGIQAALASGTYNVPRRLVASRMVDAMLGGQQ